MVSWSFMFVEIQANVHQTQDVIELILDSSRNSLLALDLKVRRSLTQLIPVGRCTETHPPS